jgi:glycosyltransferase involved in cell wall biosynthesis
VDTKAAPALPLVTAIVPAFNAEATLSATLRSVAAQTYATLEIVIVDDGSTDSTAAIAERFCAGEPRARLIRKANGGASSARNAGIAAARGDYVAPIDADDLWHPAKIERQVAAALAAPEPPGFVYCWFRVIDADDRVSGDSEPHRVAGRAFQRLAYRNFVGNGSGPLVRRDAALSVGGYDEALWGVEDIAFQLALARRWPVAAVPQYLVGYRVHGGGLSQDRERMLRAWEGLLDTLSRGDPPVPRRVIGWNLAIRSFGLAEQRAGRGDWGGALRLLLRALRLDPARTGAHLGYRAARLVRRKLGGRRQAPQRPGFFDVDPTTRVGSDPHEVPTLTRALERLEARRLARLTD